MVSAEARGFVLGGAVAAQTGPDSSSRVSPASCHARRARWTTSSSTASTPWRCTATRSSDGARVLVHDDLLATGGTAAALCDLVEASRRQVAGCAFVIELAFLGGRQRLAPHEVTSLVTFAEEG